MRTSRDRSLGSMMGSSADCLPRSVARSLGDAECRSRADLALESLRGLVLVAEVVDVEEPLNCASPALMPILVCTHLWNGEECMKTLCFLFLDFELPPELLDMGEELSVGSFDSSSSTSVCAADSAFSFKDCSRACSKAAIRRPSARDWFQPPYVIGGSYGVGEERCQLLSAASSRAPCLRSSYQQ